MKKQISNIIMTLVLTVSAFINLNAQTEIQNQFPEFFSETAKPDRLFTYKILLEQQDVMETGVFDAITSILPLKGIYLPGEGYNGETGNIKQLAQNLTPRTPVVWISFEDHDIALQYFSDNADNLKTIIIQKGEILFVSPEMKGIKSYSYTGNYDFLPNSDEKLELMQLLMLYQLLGGGLNSETDKQTDSEDSSEVTYY